jgi:hypothetical protein
LKQLSLSHIGERRTWSTVIVYGGCQADERGQKPPRLHSGAADNLFCRIRGLLQSLAPTRLVGALASGADILFARAALEQGIALEVLLPLDVATFRKMSVEPAGEPWLGDYDRITTTAGSQSVTQVLTQLMPLSSVTTTSPCWTRQNGWPIRRTNGSGPSPSGHSRTRRRPQ